MPRETRDRVGEIRATEVDGSPGVDLQVIKPGVVDDYGSVWMADCFDDSLRTRMPVLCWGHDWTNPLGPAKGFELDPVNGPRVRFGFSDFDAVPTARRAHAQTQDGTITDCSVGFSVPDGGRRDPTEEEQAKWLGVREVIEKAELDEVSLVLRGAVPGAKVLAVRSAQGTVDIEAVVVIARKKAAGELTEDEAQTALSLLATSTGETAGSDNSGMGAEPAEDLELDAAEAMEIPEL